MKLKMTTKDKFPTTKMGYMKALTYMINNNHTSKKLSSFETSEPHELEIWATTLIANVIRSSENK
jgi:hypothetical protein